ncbi:unnamed protein product [Caenorhabditis nigoni]|uniref:Uncharacterized protein n=1 Tax=Caenorhabditis nigoni TaxID=1611254 RepID=A0A2G5V9Y4_9PELO|nr:hypothetical protein B9Z55_007421 [Caenorhabditis nigoni]
MPRKRKNPKNGVAKEPEDPINHVESVDDLISLLPIPPAESFRTNDNKENSETYEFTYYKSSECWSNEKEDYDGKIEKMECENEELKVEREEFIEKIDKLEAEVKMFGQEKEEAVQKLKQMECENEKLEVEQKQLIEKIECSKWELIFSYEGMEEAKQKSKQLEFENKELKFDRRESVAKIEDFKSFISKQTFQISELQKQLDSRNLNKDVLIKNQKDELKHLKIMLQDKEEECENIMKSYSYYNHQVSSLQAQVADLQKKPKPFFRWLLPGIWNGFSNLCGRFRDHFIRQNIYWKLLYIFLIFSVIMNITEKKPTITKIIRRPKIMCRTRCKPTAELVYNKKLEKKALEQLSVSGPCPQPSIISQNHLDVYLNVKGHDLIVDLLSATGSTQMACVRSKCGDEDVISIVTDVQDSSPISGPPGTQCSSERLANPQGLCTQEYSRGGYARKGTEEALWTVIRIFATTG